MFHFVKFGSNTPNPEDSANKNDSSRKRAASTAGSSSNSTSSENNKNQVDRTFKQLSHMLTFVQQASIGKIHLGVTCNRCQRENLPFLRYKCLTCNNFDLCSGCQYENPQFQNHKKNHPLLVCQKPLDQNEEKAVAMISASNTYAIERALMEKQALKHNSTCSGCGVQPISGIKYKCDVCVGLNLCLNCLIKNNYGEKFEDKHEAAHSMLAYLFQDRVDINKLTKVKVLGSGAFGEVYEAKDEDGRSYAVKKISLSFTDRSQLNMNQETIKNEMEAYQELVDAHLVAFKGTRLCLNISKMSLEYEIAMEMMNGGTLKSVLQQRDINNYQKLCILVEVLSGLRKVHRKGYCHRDIKPENIFLDADYRTKLGDLGVSGQAFTNKLCGTWMWLAPQVFKVKALEKESSVLGELLTLVINNQTIDIYSIGLLINYIFTEKMHARGQLGETLLLEKTKYFPATMNKCLSSDQDDRPSADSLYKLFFAVKLAFKRVLAKKEIPLNKLSDEEVNIVFQRVYEAVQVS